MAWSGSCKISRIAYNVSTDSGHQPMCCLTNTRWSSDHPRHGRCGNTDRAFCFGIQYHGQPVAVHDTRCRSGTGRRVHPSLHARTRLEQDPRIRMKQAHQRIDDCCQIITKGQMAIQSLWGINQKMHGLRVKTKSCIHPA